MEGSSLQSSSVKKAVLKNFAIFFLVNICEWLLLYGNVAFSILVHALFISNTRLKLAKNCAKAKQYPETELLTKMAK